MEVRLLKSEEWELLKPIFEQEGGKMPDPNCSRAAVAFDEQGLAGFWTLQLCFHAGPLWIRPDMRGKRLWEKLQKVLSELFFDRGSGYYSFAGEPKVESILKKSGYEKLPYSLWKREF